ncbi:autotransporter outer membrane beta-barrel domain-containing protein [Phascolarctobacterium faecium]|uniref:autotransporter outer membrane beta-barrel domain-containing protein n=1 Tax=Phascolarctobacterium faecium TaxID=33025 RepID=UPI0032BFD10D
MSRKQSLAKKIAHTLMAMSIVYSSGINIVVNQVYAAETKNLTNSDSTFSKEGVRGNNYNDVGGVTDGESVVFTGIVTENITNNIVVDVKGGKGGNDNNYSSGSPTVSVGAKGGSGIAQITIDESLSDIKLGNISISAYGATQGQSIYAISNVGGAAEAYGLQVKHDLKITAADITVEAKSNSSIISNIGDFKKPDTIAVGLQVEGSKVDFTGGGINLSVKTNSYYPGSQSNRQPGNYDGVDAKAYGIRSSISETTVKLNGNLTFMEVNGGDGDSYGYIDANSGVGAGCGGNATAYGIEVNGGKAHLDLKNIATDSDNSLRGGNGGSGSGNSSILTSVVGGSGGMVTASGVHIAGGKADGNIGNITMSGSGGIGGIGGGMDEGAAAIGGVGGAAVMAGIGAEAGQTELTVAKVNIKTTGGQGGTGGASIRGTSGVGGTGGTAYAHGVLGIAASSMQVKAADIIVSGIGGVGGTGGSNYNNGGVGGTGGAAEAYGISAVNSVVNIDVANIQTTATGGKGGTGDQGGKYSYKGNGGDGGVGGNAYAYGVQSSGGTVTAATDKITATASGGMAGAAGSGNNGGVAGTVGAIGAEAKAYGIYAESGAVVNLSGKTPSGTITIGAKADNAQNTEAYAVYADKATVLFNDNAVLNTSDGSTDDNTVLTYLKDATLGFGGTDANRTVTGGTLKLEGSNTFRVTTDLKSDAADKFTFNSLAAGSSTENQYITVGYDKAFDGSDLTSINGDAVVLTFGELNGQNLNFEGKTSTLDSPLTRFTATPTVETSGNDVKITQIDFGKNPDSDASETAMVGSDAQMALGSMWRIEGNNLMKRMGELRSDKEAAKGGVWARYYRGELSADSAYDRNYSQDYTAFQGGIDKEQDYKGGKLYTGIAVNRIDSNAGYTAGSGDLSSTGVGVYASWLGSKGHYVDVIARGSKLANDFKLVDLSGNAAKADYDTWAYGISAEYGYRQQLNAGWFVEPQAELSLGRIGSVDYTTSNGVTIKQDSVNSAVVRLGFLGGKEFTIGGRASNAYVKASALHDFGGNGGATGYYGSDSLALQTGDLTGTWYEIGLGANLGIAKNSNLYFDALKTFGGNLRTDWQFNAGLRFTF